jgi:AraC family transcriptional regulator
VRAFGNLIPEKTFKTASMEVRIEKLEARQLVGMRLQMSFAQNRTAELWRSFMPLRRVISLQVEPVLYSLQNYPESFFESFNPVTEFEKWAALEVSEVVALAEGMETFLLPAGMYAVFLYKGHPAEGAKAFQYIMGTWLPASGYKLDNRPHFEKLGEKYKHESPDSEEEIWIPVREIRE